MSYSPIIVAEYHSYLYEIKSWKMGKLKLLMQISVDGYVGGPDGDLDWRTWDYDDKLKAFANNLRDGCDAILLGRKMAEVFIPHFEETVNRLQAKKGDKALVETFAYEFQAFKTQNQTTFRLHPYPVIVTKS